MGDTAPLLDHRLTPRVISMFRSASIVPQSASPVPASSEFPLEYDPWLVEEAVLCALRIRAEETTFRVGRNRLYEIQDPEERGAAFHDFHAAWFERLGLGRVLWQALHEQPLIVGSTRVCVVMHARTSRNEGAELFVCPGGEGTGETTRRSVGIRLLPQSLLDPETLLAFLRHELFHIGDMLEPAFGYEPRLPRAELGPAHEALLQDWYRVLWDTYIDGRLLRQGRAPASIREARLREFLRTFAMLGGQTVEAFASFFSGGPLTHSALVAFATDPVAAVNVASGPLAPTPVATRSLTPGSRCPLCGFPTHAFETHPDQLPPAVVDRIRISFPTWTPSWGLCQQCAGLYNSGASHAPGPLES